MMGKGPVLVIGATGNQGGEVARALLDAGWTVHAFTRNAPSPKAQALKTQGAVLVQGDLSDLTALKAAMQTCAGVFSVQNFWDLGLDEEVRLGSNVIQAAKEAGTRPHVVYSSGLGAEQRQNVAAIDGKAIIEEKLRDAKLPSTVLRPGLFMDDFQGASLPFARSIQRALENHRALVGRVFLAILRALVPKDNLIPLTTLHDVGRMALWAFDHPAMSQGQVYHVVGSVETAETLCILWEQVMKQSIPRIPAWKWGLQIMHPKMAALLAWLGQHQAHVCEEPLVLQTYQEWLLLQSF